MNKLGGAVYHKRDQSRGFGRRDRCVVITDLGPQVLRQDEEFGLHLAGSSQLFAW